MRRKRKRTKCTYPCFVIDQLVLVAWVQELKEKNDTKRKKEKEEDDVE